MFRKSVRPWTLPAVAFVSLLCVVPGSAESELTQYLNDNYEGRTFVLRAFHTGGHLEYDSAGRAINPGPADDWTVAGVVHVEYLGLSGHHLNLVARRLHLGWSDGIFQEFHDYDQEGKPDKNEKQNRSLIIEADLGLATIASADRILSQIFLSSQDNFADFVPDYWKPCIAAATTGKGSEQLSACHFSDEFSKVPGVTPTPGKSAEPAQTTEAQAPFSTGAVYRVGGGVTAPTPLNRPAASFSEEARHAKLAGTSVLTLVVDKMGGVRDIRILRPLGIGLDQKAIEVVQQYRFNPATRNGQPVAVQVALEIDFHLY